MTTTRSTTITSNVNCRARPWPTSPGTIISSFRFPNLLMEIFIVALIPLNYNLTVNVSVHCIMNSNWAKDSSLIVLCNYNILGE